MRRSAQRRRRPTTRRARAWLKQRLQPYRVESHDGTAEGLATGYFEPLVDASRERRGAYRVPLHGPPADLATRKPYWTRQQLDTLPAAMAALRGREIAYVADPLDALVAAGAGLGPAADRRVRRPPQLVRVAFAGHNDEPYRSVGRWLIEQGELQRRRGVVAGDPGLGAHATRSASTRCCGATRASCSSAKSRCPIRPSARAAPPACR